MLKVVKVFESFYLDFLKCIIYVIKVAVSEIKCIILLLFFCIDL